MISFSKAESFVKKEWRNRLNNSRQWAYSDENLKGIPLEAALLPLLRSLVVDYLVELLTNNCINSKAYTDGIVIIAVGEFENILWGIIKKALTLTRKLCLKTMLSINPAKTAVVPLSKRNKRNMKHIRLNIIVIESIYKTKD